ncbi:amidohydrolase family protein [Pseudomonas aeruginosa]
MTADLILHNGRFHTVDRDNPTATAVAIKDGKFLAVGNDAEAMLHRGSATQVIDLQKRTVIPGLNDSHLHLIRGGLNYNLELRWEGVPSLADALRMLKNQAERTPSPQWVRVVGGWNEFQFAEKRMPTLEELNKAAPDTPVFVLHLYDRALLNRAALRVVGYTKDTPNPPGGEIVRDSAWFSSEQGKKGQIKVGQLADLAALSADFFGVEEEAIKWIESVLTVVDGKVVYAAAEFDKLGPPAPPVLPDWSPVAKVPGHWRQGAPLTAQVHQCVGACAVHAHEHNRARHSNVPVSDFQGFWGAFGCSCFAF